jgi:hypothetical protein
MVMLVARLQAFFNYIMMFHVPVGEGVPETELIAVQDAVEVEEGVLETDPERELLGVGVGVSEGQNTKGVSCVEVYLDTVPDCCSTV